MTMSEINLRLVLDRRFLEAVARYKVCSCLYYDLCDSLDAVSDADLFAIINGLIKCDSGADCSQSEGK